MQQQPASTGASTPSAPQRPDDRISSIMEQQNPISRTMGQQQQQPTAVGGGTSSGFPGSQDRFGMSAQQQQQPASMGGMSSTATQGTQGGSAMQQQQQPGSTGMLGSGHKTHPTHSPSHGLHGHRKANLQGHVFSRLHRFSGLPPDLQQDTKEFEAFAEQHKDVIFSNTKHALIKTVYGVKGKELVDAIIEWLEARDAHQPTPGQGQGQAMMPSTVTMTTAGGEPIHSSGGPTSSAQNASTMGGASTGQGASSMQQSPNILPGTEVSQGSSGAQTTGLTGNNNNNNNVGQTHHHGLTGTHDNTRGTTGDHAHHGPMDTIRATAHGPRGANVPAQEENAGNRGHHMPFSHGDATHGRSSSSRANHLHRAREIAEALVLLGFITPYKDDEKHSTHLKHYVTDHELFVPVGKNVTESGTTSVWSVVDGATYAFPVKHKAGLMGAIGDGKDVYVVFNEHNNVAYLFESDVARDVISQIHGETVNVQFESDHFPFGVLVESSLGDEKMKPELFNAESKRVQEEFVNAWLSIGAQYRENSIKRIVEADSTKSGMMGSGLAGKHSGANMDESTMVGQQELRGADLAATGAGTGAGGVGGSSAMNQSNIGNANSTGIGVNNDIGGNDGMPTTAPTQSGHHSKTKDALYDAGAAAGAGGALAHHDRYSADREGRFNDTSYGVNDPRSQNRDLHSGANDGRSFEAGYGGAAATGATPSQHHHDHHLGTRDESSYNAPYGGDADTLTTRLKHHHLGRDEPTYEQGYGETGTQSKHHHDHHLLGRRDDDPNYNEAGYGSGAASSQRQDQHFGGAQDGPSLAAPFGGGAAAADTQSKHHHDRDHHDRDHYLGGHHQDPAYDAPYGGDSATMGSKHHHDRHDQENASPARKTTDIAAAKIAGIEPTDQYTATQGSAAPSSSKYQQECPICTHNTRAAP